jgi:site-specific DNA-methyltransferase (adenine-specific)
MHLVNEMLDKLPKDVWKDKTLKWFDPAVGMGNFPIAVYLRLMKGLKNKISDKNKRKKHILEKMLYMSELNKKNVLICKQIFDINNEYKLNIYNGDSLKADFNKEFGIKEFDIIIGNPPYNEELKKSGARPLYNKFIECFINKCNLLSFIIPSRWFSGGKGLDKFRKMMLDRTDIVYIKHFDNASKIFGNLVEIKGGVNYFLINKKYKGLCNFNDNMLKLNKYDVFVDSKYYSLLDKLNNHKSINSIYIGRYFGIESNDKRLNDNNDNGNSIKCYVSKQKGFIKYINNISKKYDFWKIITTRSSFGANSGFGNTFIGNTKEVHSCSYISFKIETKEQAKSLLSYILCRLPNLMLSLRKSSQDISENTCKWIPLPPLDRIWTNKKIYKYYKLNNDDIELIKNAKIYGYN